ncbi:type 4a pilus biogenesis protein PilO [bacterium]|nr:type 4a pilus biogenesis protein PilO [candidate division CSSED10-310 bacterium]
MMIGIALAIAVIYVAIDFVIDPLAASYEKKKEMLESREQLLKKYEHLIETADRTRDKLQKITAIESAIRKGLLTGTNPDLANAELQGIVKDIAKKADIRFSRITPAKTVEEKGFTQISLKLPFSGSIRQIAKFLYEIESSPWMLNISSLSIRSRRQDKGDLRVEMEITAFIRTSQEDVSGSDQKDSESI